MSIPCKNCGNLCRETDHVCPVCGSPLTILNPMPVQPMPQQQAPQPAPKKKHTLAIVLSIVGGVLVLLILLIVLLVIGVRRYLGSQPGLSTGGTATITSHTDPHDYYYPDYEASDLNSEAYADPSTEAPASSSTEENAAAASETDPAASGDASRFTSDDLTLYLVNATTDETINTLPVTNILNDYTIGSDGRIQGTTEPIAASVDYRTETGRHIRIGTSYDSLISTYGIDSTNAIWSALSAETGSHDYYYFSTIAQPDTPEQHTLILGWGNTENGWKRLYSEGLATASEGTLPDANSSVLLYRFSFDAEFQVSSIQITYLGQ